MTPTIGVVTLCTGRYRYFAEIIRQNRVQYCERHKYKLKWFDEQLDKDRPIPWSKLLAIREALEQCDVACWVDGDVLIMNQQIPIGQFLEPGFEIVLSAHPRGDLQSGVLICRDSQFCLELLDRVRRLGAERDFDDWEQGAINEIYDNDPDVRARVKVLPFGALQSAPREIRKHVESHNMGKIYEDGDFSVHCFRPSDKALLVARYAGFSRANRTP